MSRPLLTSTFIATTAVAGRRFVKHGAADGAAVQATTTTEALLGVSAPMGADAAGTLDVVEAGCPEIEYGGNVARGDPLTSDASGRAVKANPGAGVVAQVGGYARISGALGDFGSINLSRGQIKG